VILRDYDSPGERLRDMSDEAMPMRHHATNCDAKIRHVLFDLGNVLIPVDWGRAFNRLFPMLPVDKAGLLRRDRTAFQALYEKPFQDLETGRIDFAEFHGAVSEILGISLPMDHFRQVFCDIFRIDLEMVGLGERLSVSHGTWLVSNTSRAHYEWIIANFPRVAFYRDAALSYELGVMKPSNEYYAKMVERFGINPEESVFIDDLEQNVEGAVRCGIRGIVFRDRIQLVRELQALGLVIS
jgi:FMN phosphatase YigB (HAD superfamily)